MTLALCASGVFGQTVSKLIEKYKALPGAVYENTTEESLKSMDQQEESSLTAEEYAKLKKNFKKSEQVQVKNATEEQLAQLEEDIKALKGYDLLFVTNKNTKSEEAKNIFQQMISDVMNPSFKLRCYGKVKGKIVRDVLVRLDMWNTVVISHIDTKIEKDLLLKSMADTEFSTDEADDEEAIDMKDVLEEAKNGNALIVIDGKEYPDLHSSKEAHEYMEAHDMWFNHENWIVGGAVKEKYPNTDKKVVIEFSRQEKKQD